MQFVRSHSTYIPRLTVQFPREYTNFVRAKIAQGATIHNSEGYTKITWVSHGWSHKMFVWELDNGKHVSHTMVRGGVTRRIVSRFHPR